jgi:hypothetical protein
MAVILFAGLLRVASPADAQQQNPSDVNAMPRVTVHGVVLNTATGEPLARALVRLGGEGTAGALTDGDGHYEIADVLTGLQQFEVIKPGFLDATAEASAPWGNSAREYAHTVVVAAGMPDVTFRMEPANAIHGIVQLSTGDSAEGIDISLLRQTVIGGRFTWQTIATVKANAEGAYRFGNLPDGVYAIDNAPAMEAETAIMPGELRPNPAERAGYPSTFYPGARDLSGAAKISLHQGEQAEANFPLALETFHPVTAAVSVPNDTGDSSDGRETSMSIDTTSRLQDHGLSASVADSQGHSLPYLAQYDHASHAVQALLPDGNYVLMVTAQRPRLLQRRSGISGISREEGPYSGAAEFAVNGHAVNSLRIGLASAERSTLQVNVARGATTANLPASNTDEHSVVLTISQTAGSATDSFMSTLAMGPLAGSISTMYAPSGTYWVHTNLADKNYCVDSLLAGGSNLAREPLTLSVSGSTTPLTLNLRDDCAKLTLTLPATAAGAAAGEEPAYTIYAVPDFDSTEDVIPQTLRPSNGGKITLEGLTPGSYHVYAFDRPVALAYREKPALDAAQGPSQAVDLAPGESANLVVEIAR